MTFEERLARIRSRMEERGLDLLVGVHDGAHFIEKPNPVMVLSGFKSLGPAAVVMTRRGEGALVLVPSWDAARAAERCPALDIVPTDSLVHGLALALSRLRRHPANESIGICGLSAMPWSEAEQIASLVPRAPVGPSDSAAGHARHLGFALSQSRMADDLVFGAARTKTDQEIAHAREATRIAERTYQRLIAIARPGMSEDELAVELRWYSKTLGAEDNFLLLCAGPHNRAVAPSHGRKLEAGDVIVVEITPSYRGQLAQICRTVVVGRAGETLREKYALVVSAMEAGFAAARPGAAMAEVCRAVNAVLEAQGYGAYCHPPHIRRRGHGLGFGAIEPGDVALDNATVLEPDMLFMIHPNQYLPETGYLLCGEPALITGRGAEPLTARQAALAELAG
jgi:Xaa-Pro aminopeptidase